MRDDDPEATIKPDVVEKDLRSRGTKLLSNLFAGLLPTAATDRYEPLLRKDGLALFVEIVSTIMPATSNSVKEDEDMWAWTRLVYVFDVTRTALAVSFLAENGGLEGLALDDPDDAEQIGHAPFRAKELVAWIAQQCSLEGAEAVGTADESVVQKLLVTMLLPVLRRYALLLHARFGIIPPPKEEPAGKSPASAGLSHGGADESEFDRLTAFLRLPTLADICGHILGSPASASSAAGDTGNTLNKLVKGWCSSYADWQLNFRDGQHRGAQEHHVLVADPRVMHLVSPPQQLTSLIESSIAFVCSKCGTSPANPALCLFCGDFVCAQSPCCSYDQTRQGECNLHMIGCGGETGIFFLVKKGAILHVNRKNGILVPMPYLDAHGESDIGLR
jgi:E3 ubiquitin-protein ligase UBR1